MTRSVFAIATMDTKAQEIEFVATCLRSAGVSVKVVDVGTLEAVSGADVSRAEVLGKRVLPDSGERGEAVTAMGEALAEYLVDVGKRGEIAGVIGIGGSGGTALITRAMRDLPIGLPKFMLSTVASGNTAPYVDCSDICMMFSVVDIAGLNVVSEKVLANAAHAMAGMVSQAFDPKTDGKPCLGMTMFGVTTPCVTMVREQLEAEDYDCLVFHATGTGGRAMEGLVRSGLIQGVLDLTTTEVADEIVGGVFPAGPKRFEATLSAGIPLVLSVGAVDMVNFGALETVPAKFRDRVLHQHNAQVTLMRTSVEENLAIGKWIAEKINAYPNCPVTLLLPLGGVSMLDAPGQPFHDPDADAALFETLASQVEVSPSRRILKLEHHINSPEFAQAACDAFRSVNS